MELAEIKSKLKNGKRVKAEIALEREGGKIHRRVLRLMKTQYSSDGYDVVATTPKFKNYHLKGSEIIRIVH